MTFKLVQSAQQRWNRLKGTSLLREMIDEVKFVDGIPPRRVRSADAVNDL